MKKAPYIIVVILILGALSFYIYQPAKAAVLRVVYSLRFTSGLVGYWSFDGPTINWSTGQVTDLSGNSNSGTLSGTISTSTQAVPGIVGQALSFDGINDYINVPDPGSSSLDLTGDTTITLWINPAPVQNSSATLLSKHNSGGTAYTIENDGGTGNNYLFAWGNGSFVCAATFFSLTANVWQHLAIVKSGTTATWYVNGASIGSCTASPATIGTNNLALKIGDWSSGGSRWWKGKIDELRIYNRALSTGEVNFQYQRTAREYGNKATFAGGATTTPAYVNVTSTSGDAKATNPISFSHTVLTGSNRLLLVKVGINMANTGGTCSPCSVSSITYAGSSLTKLVAAGPTTETCPSNRAEMWYLKNPPVGTGTVSVTYNVPSAGTLETVIGAENWRGVDQTTPFGQTTPNGANFSTAVAGTSTAAIVVTDVVSVRTGHTGTVGSGQSQHYKITTVGQGGGDDRSAASHRLVLQTGTSQMNWTDDDGGGSATCDGAGNEWAMAAAAVNPATAFLANASQSNKFTNGLVGYWSMDGSTVNWSTGQVAELSGNSGAGTLSGSMATTTQVLPGIIGQAVLFDGSNDRITVPDDADLRVTTSFTLSAWIKLDGSNVPSTLNMILAKNNADTIANSPGYEMRVAQTTGKIDVTLGDGTTFATLTSNTAVNDGNWHLVTFTRDSSNNWIIYLDGRSDNSQNNANNPDQRTQPLYIGMREGNPSGSGIYFFKGLIDEVRIYNRTLSSGDVYELYRSGKR